MTTQPEKLVHSSTCGERWAQYATQDGHLTIRIPSEIADRIGGTDVILAKIFSLLVEPCNPKFVEVDLDEFVAGR